MDHRQMLEEIAEIASEILNEWEFEFIENMLDWDGEITDTQKKRIEKIYEKACRSPY